MTLDSIQPGTAATARLKVSEADLAIALGSCDLPVLATPRLVALCEQATVAVLAGSLPDGVTSVGVRVELDHLAASRINEEVVATATLTDQNDGQLVFVVAVTDAAGSVVARSRIERVVVDRARFLDQ